MGQGGEEARSIDEVRLEAGEWITRYDADLHLSKVLTTMADREEGINLSAHAVLLSSDVAEIALGSGAASTVAVRK